MRNLWLLAAALLPALNPVLALGQEDLTGIISDRARQHPVIDTEGMVATQHALATEVGARILADGGNAVDAGIAVGFALAVVLPRAGNIGGGGFMLVYDARSDDTVAIDYREMAPPRASRDMYLDESGDVDTELARYSHLSSGTPGTVAGLWEAHRRYGSLEWSVLLAPAVRLARDGFIVTWDLAKNLAARKERLSRFPGARRYFYKPDGSSYAAGERLVQPDLADTLELIAEQGPRAFYEGAIADMIAAEMAAHGGLVDKVALAAYKPVIREPVRGTYRGDYEIVSMPPSSSGGIHVIQMLNVLEHFPLREMGYGSADSIHVLAETMKLAFADRSKHLGDMDYWNVPVTWLTSREYAKTLADSIDMRRARPSTDIAPGVPPVDEGPDTTHFSIMDADGNAVANTYTLNASYGSGIAVDGAGFLLNDEMDDFSAKPGVPNMFGLIGDEANAIEAGKRPLSAMTPTIVFRDGKPWLVTGSPGGSRIITTVLQMIVNVIDHDMNIAEAVNAPRMHHQWLPDETRLESGFSPDTMAELRRRGHNLAAFDSMGSLQSIIRRDQLFRGYSDPRRPDASTAGAAMYRATH